MTFVVFAFLTFGGLLILSAIENVSIIAALQNVLSGNYVPTKATTPTSAAVTTL